MFYKASWCILLYTNTSNIIKPAHAKCIKPESVLDNAVIFQVACNIYFQITKKENLSLYSRVPNTEYK